MVPVDAQPAVVPVHARHVAARVARTAAERDVFHVQVLARLVVVLELQYEPLEKGDALDVALAKRVGREVLEFLVSLAPVAQSDGVSTALGATIVGGYVTVQVVHIGVDLEALAAGRDYLVHGKTLGN